MTNKEKYKKAFSTLHASDNISLEVKMMEERKSVYRMKKIAAACAAAAIVFGSMTVAYAADLGGIQQKIKAWIHGEQTEMHVTGDDGKGNYTYTYTDENGETQEFGAGGVAIDDSGNEIPISAEDVLEVTNSEVKKDADGKIWLYHYAKKIDITDLFGEDGFCRVAVEYDGETTYYEIDGRAMDGAETDSYGYSSTTGIPENKDAYTFIE